MATMTATMMIKAIATTSTKRGQDPLLFHAPLRIRLGDGWKDGLGWEMGWMNCLGIWSFG